MLRIQVHHYIQYGERIQAARLLFKTIGTLKPLDSELGKAHREEIGRATEQLKQHLVQLEKFLEPLRLTIAKELLNQKVRNPPKTIEEFDLLMNAIHAELKERLFLFVPGHRTQYFEKNDLVSDNVKKNFPVVVADIREAAKCVALGLYTASVFHSMRAVEVGMRELARSLDVSFDFPLEQAPWANVIDQIEKKVRALNAAKKTAGKDDDLNFYSEACMQFRYFKDAWRVRVSHARENYDEPVALSVMDHAITFFEIVAKRLKERMV